MEPDPFLIPPLDPDLVSRIEAAKDDRGVIHDEALANEYFDALVAQNAELERQRIERYPVEPVPVGSRVFPTSEADGEMLLEPTPETFVREPGDDEPGDDEPGDDSQVTVIIN